MSAAAWCRGGERLALTFSIALAALLALHAFMAMNDRPLIPFLRQVRGLFPAILFGLMALEGYQELQRQQARDAMWHDRDPWR